VCIGDLSLTIAYRDALLVRWHIIHWLPFSGLGKRTNAMASSNFEFKYRFWIFSALFCIAFSSYLIDHQNTGAMLAEWIARLRSTTATTMDYHAIFAVARCFALRRPWSAPGARLTSTLKLWSICRCTARD